MKTFVKVVFPAVLIGIGVWVIGREAGLFIQLAVISILGGIGILAVFNGA